MRLNPIAKLLAALGLAIAVFFNRSIPELVLILMLVIVVGLLANQQKLMLALGLGLLPLSASMVLIQSLNSSLDGNKFMIWGISFYELGVYQGIWFFLRIAIGVLAFGVALNSIAQRDLLAALRKIGIPRNVVSMIFLSLQLFPQMHRSLTVVLEAQRARGLELRGFRALIPSLIPTFSLAVDRMTQLIQSLESRGLYSKRTSSYVQSKWSIWDSLLLLIVGWSILLQFTLQFPWELNLNEAVLIMIPPVAALLLVGSLIAGSSLFGRITDR